MTSLPGSASSVPVIRSPGAVRASCVTTGKFWMPFAPASVSPASLGVTPVVEVDAQLSTLPVTVFNRSPSAVGGVAGDPDPGPARWPRPSRC